MQILVADDTKSSLFAVERVLRASGHDVITAADGQEAWEKLQNGHDIGLVVSDWIMPGLTGPQLCEKIRSSDLGRYIYVILLTSKNRREDFIEGMTAGADDFVVKPFHQAELKVRVRSGQRIVDLERQLSAHNKKLDRALAALETDLEAASQVQRDLLPQGAGNFDAVRLEHLFLPSAYVSGDGFGYFPLDDENLGFYSLDVSGHGVPSALLSVAIHEALRPWTFLDEEGKPRNPAHIMAELNERFEDQGDLYFTALLGVIQQSTGRVHYCQAGHPPGIHLSADGKATLFGDGGFPVGMISGATYESDEIVLKPGEQVFLYTDGVMDCQNVDGQMFGEDRFVSAVTTGAGGALSEVLAGVESSLLAWVGDRPLADDVSLLGLQYKS